jgi:hypothetical protein
MPSPSHASSSRVFQPHQGVACRVWERHLTELPATGQTAAARPEQDVAWRGTIREVSADGLGLVLERGYECGTGLAVELPPTAGDPGDTLLVRVTQAAPLPDGRWLLDCSLIGQLSDDEIERVVHRAVPQEAAPAVVHGVTFRGVADDGTVVVLAVKRLAPRAPWPPAAGSTVAVRVNGKGASAVPLRLVVQGCREQEGRWLVEGRLVDAPNLAALR